MTDLLTVHLTCKHIYKRLGSVHMGPVRWWTMIDMQQHARSNAAQPCIACSKPTDQQTQGSSYQEWSKARGHLKTPYELTGHVDSDQKCAKAEANRSNVNDRFRGCENEPNCVQTGVLFAGQCEL